MEDKIEPKIKDLPNIDVIDEDIVKTQVSRIMKVCTKAYLKTQRKTNIDYFIYFFGK